MQDKINEEKLRSDFDGVELKHWSSRLSEFVNVPLSCKKQIADYWIEKIKQSNLALLEEVEKEHVRREIKTIKGIIKGINKHLKDSENEIRKFEGEDCEITKDYKLACKNIVEILSTLSKHKERLTCQCGLQGKGEFKAGFDFIPCDNCREKGY
jgi:hypothetical protein